MGEKEKQIGHNIVEKITFFIGLSVLIVIISSLIFQWSNSTDNPPHLVINTIHQPDMDHYGFKVEAENTGDKTAEAAQISLSLYQEGKVAEMGTIEFQYVPVKSKETGWIVFHTERKPNDSLVISSVTYAKP